MERVCKVCGAEIPAERLEALPETDTCVQHSPTGRAKGYMVATASKGTASVIEIIKPDADSETKRLAERFHRRSR